jgi:hypothetical protein
MIAGYRIRSTHMFGWLFVMAAWLTCPPALIEDDIDK